MKPSVDDLIDTYYGGNPGLRNRLLRHSRAVADKALSMARRLDHPGLDLAFIEEAALLHDIGIFLTAAPKIGCYGPDPYVRHGILGREILEKAGLPRHALVCERHVGAGISAAEIRTRRLPLPVRDMVPLNPEEKIICLADKFFSKTGTGEAQEKPLSRIREELGRLGPEQLGRFECWLAAFSPAGC